MSDTEMLTFRACLGCYQVKVFEQFVVQGCENCDACLKLKNNPDNVRAYTTKDFLGMVYSKYPSFGSVCLAIGLTNGIPGMYARVCDDILHRNKIEEMRTMVNNTLRKNNRMHYEQFKKE